MLKTVRIEEVEIDDVYKAAKAIRAVNKLIKKACCSDQPNIDEGAFDAIDIIASSLTDSLWSAIRTEEGK